MGGACVTRNIYAGYARVQDTKDRHKIFCRHARMGENILRIWASVRWQY